MKIFIKFINKLKTDGFNAALQKSIDYLLWKLTTVSKIEKERLNLSNKLLKLHNNTVAYGFFRGMKFSGESSWGKGDRAAMILGLYEEEVQKELSDASEKYDVFINLGAADGFFSIGSIISNKFKECYCYEISAAGREAIKLNAIRNSVEDKITINGIADENFPDRIPSGKLERAIILCDIEGGESELFNKKVFEKLRKSIVIIEVHEALDGTETEVDNIIESALIKSASDYFDYKILTTGSRDPSKFKELSGFSDNKRWLIYSEGRPYLMRWLVLTPKETVNE